MSVCLSKTTHSLKRIFVWMILVACLSSLVTYHIGLLLPWVEMSQSVGQVQRQLRMTNENLGRPLDNPELKQHPYRKLSQASDHQNQNSQISHIFEKLKQVEERIQSISAYRTVLSSGLDKNQTQILRKAFSKYTVVSTNQTSDNKDKYSVIWSSQKNDINRLSYQKYNQIPVLQHVVNQPGYICYLHNVYSKITESYNTSCYDTLSSRDSKASHDLTFWQHEKEERIQTNLETGASHIKHKGSVWQSKGGLLKLNDQILHIQLFVYVASVLPLRIYVHAGSTIDKIKIDMTNRYGETSQEQWWKKLKESVVVSLLTSESLTLTIKDHQNYKCYRCTQLLQYDVVFTSSLHPIILKVKPLIEIVHSEILADIVNLITTTETVSMEVALVLGESSSNILMGRKECQRGYGICLFDTDLVYLLENFQDSKVGGKFIKLYPSQSDDYTHFINKLPEIWKIEKSLLEIHSHGNKVQEFHTTPDIHYLLQQMESYIKSNVDYTEEDLLRSNKLPNTNFHRHLKSSDQKDYILLDDHTPEICSGDPEDMVLLSNIEMNPSVNVDFNPYQYMYSITVTYDTILLQIQATTKGCQTEARFDDINGCVSHCNYTIGLGDNTIRIYVVDLSKNHPVIINTYTLNIRRKDGRMMDSPNSVLNTCVLKQDCGLKYLPNEDCGLQQSREYSSWNHFVSESRLKSYCKDYLDWNDAVWTVPCRSCDNRESCYWQQARWQPSSCQHGQYSYTDAKKCFRGKKLLFIGDSTNRGIMHYILEKINGTLLNWDKTHDLKLYTNVNDGQTTMSFTYYPQFWLPNNHRPGFDKAIYQLIKWTSPLQNNSNTVLVVGGVHWLGKQHINIILNALKREGLTGIRLIMKGHGAGFHQHVDGVHYASLIHQQKLGLQERLVSQYAAQHAFYVVPTFNMTMSRYKDFLQGKCACHFHKVTTTTDRYGQKHYHIEGEINAAYSELVINSICHPNPD